MTEQNYWTDQITDDRAKMKNRANSAKLETPSKFIPLSKILKAEQRTDQKSSHRANLDTEQNSNPEQI